MKKLTPKKLAISLMLRELECVNYFHEKGYDDYDNLTESQKRKVDTHFNKIFNSIQDRLLKAQKDTRGSNSKQHNGTGKFRSLTPEALAKRDELLKQKIILFIGEGMKTFEEILQITFVQFYMILSPMKKLFLKTDITRPLNCER